MGLVTFTEEILNGKLNFLCSVRFAYLRWGPSIKYVRKIFGKTKISNQGFGNVSFSENFAYVLNG